MSSQLPPHTVDAAAASPGLRPDPLWRCLRIGPGRERPEPRFGSRTVLRSVSTLGARLRESRFTDTSAGSDGWKAMARAPRSPRRPQRHGRAGTVRAVMRSAGGSSRRCCHRRRSSAIVEWRPRSQKHARVSVARRLKRAAAMLDRRDRVQRTPPSDAVRGRSHPTEPEPTAVDRPLLRGPRAGHPAELLEDVATLSPPAPRAPCQLARQSGSRLARTAAKPPSPVQP